MSELEKRLHAALLSARQKLGHGDVIGAGLDLDAAVLACQQLGAGLVDDPACLRDLTQACLSAARDAERSLERELGELGAARHARAAYGGGQPR
ncbi:MAG: hypothetical protein IT383_22185 [Deltaproteobacteria bacterium]|nr:hypothetical protein [Deltaproteobacteria bacterium]